MPDRSATALTASTKAQPKALHEEGEYVPGLVAPETLVEPLRRNDIEAWGPLLVEGTPSLEVLPGPLEGYMFADDLDDVGPGPDLVYHVVGNHRSLTMVTPAPPSPGPPILNPLDPRVLCQQLPDPRPQGPRSLSMDDPDFSKTAEDGLIEGPVHLHLDLRYP